MKRRADKQADDERVWPFDMAALTIAGAPDRVNPGWWYCLLVLLIACHTRPRELHPEARDRVGCLVAFICGHA